MDRLDRLTIFLRVADSASFTRAAAQLGLPRSSVSTAVQELEAALGVRLLTRTTRHVALTEDGAAVCLRARRLLADADELENLFRMSAQSLKGRVRINVPGRIGRLIVVPALPAFLERHPGLEIDVGVTDRPVDLVQEGVDCVLRVGDLADASLIARRLGDIAFINCASPAYLARRGVPVTPADLVDHDCVRYASPHDGRAESWEYAQDGVVQTIEMAARVTVNGAEAYIAACLAGLGLIQIPAYDVARHIATGELVEVMPDLRALPAPVSILYPHRGHLSRRLRLVVDWLAALLDEAGVTRAAGAFIP